MTPNDIANISAEIEKLYESMTDELLLNIAKHLSTSTTTWTALHEIETLENMGQLTEENIAIIQSYVQQMPQAVYDAMNESRKEALGEIESMLNEAVAKGNLPKPVTDGTVAVMNDFSKQALDQLNLVNQTMLNSSLEAYQNGVYQIRQQLGQYTPETIENGADLQKSQQIIDLATGQVVGATETRTNALRKALIALNNAGITGFYDRRGRAWSGEAYVSMDIRTTVHNTYIQSIKTRQADYGSDVFQVSAHAGARPLCYPYQGKMYSWSGAGGYITLGDGKSYKYESIGVTSYGQAAGLFGINCGHVPYPMIAGVSEPVKEKIPNKEENDREYAESQQQRALERQIRSAKRGLEILGKNATEADKEAVAKAQANMREFIKQTGRTRRYDREQIVTAKRGNTGSGKTPTRPSVNPKGTTKTKTTPVKSVTPAKTTGTYKSQEVQKIADKLEKYGVKYNGVEMHKKQPTFNDIIKSIAGGDRTSGSCASCALTYIANKHGANVKDFRGGESRSFFAIKANNREVAKACGANVTVETTNREQATAKKLLESMQAGKEYFLSTGQHASIVRVTKDGKKQYLELQSPFDNGWTDFSDNVIDTLKDRFGCKRNTKYERTAAIYDIDDLKGSQDFIEIMGYINTPENEQKKGKNGNVK